MFNWLKNLFKMDRKPAEPIDNPAMQNAMNISRCFNHGHDDIQANNLKPLDELFPPKEPELYDVAPVWHPDRPKLGSNHREILTALVKNGPSTSKDIRNHTVGYRSSRIAEMCRDLAQYGLVSIVKVASNNAINPLINEYHPTENAGAALLNASDWFKR